MFLHQFEVRTEDGKPVPLAWLNSFAMRGFTGDARWDDTLPVSDGRLEAGTRVPIAELREAMEAWFRRKGWLPPDKHIYIHPHPASQ